MQRQNLLSNAWNAVSPYMGVATLVGALGTGVYGFTLGLASKAERNRLEELTNMVSDTTIYSLESANAVSVQTFSTIDELKRERGGNRFTLDMDDKNLILEFSRGDASTNLVTFEQFANPAIIERAVANGCVIAQKIQEYPDDSAYRIEKRIEMKEMATAFAAGYCTRAAP